MEKTRGAGKANSAGNALSIAGVRLEQGMLPASRPASLTGSIFVCVLPVQFAVIASAYTFFNLEAPGTPIATVLWCVDGRKQEIATNQSRRKRGNPIFMDLGEREEKEKEKHNGVCQGIMLSAAAESGQR